MSSFPDNLGRYTDACNGDLQAKYEAVTTFHDWDEYRAAARLLNTHATLSRTTTMGKGKSRGAQSVWMTRNTKRIEIQFVPQPRPQDVRESSREAFACVDTTTQVGKVASCIVDASANGGDITRAEIAYRLKMERSTTSARVNELIETCKQTPVKVGNAYYRIIELDDRRHSLTPDAAPVKVIALRAVLCAPGNYTPAAEAAQTTLFS
jgi:hypothetical protein